MASRAIGEIPKALSFAPILSSKGRPFSLSIVSGPTKGMKEGRPLTIFVKGNGSGMRGALSFL